MTAAPTRRILVVDDEPLVCDSVKMMLESDGHIVETATSSQEGLVLFARNKFDLVVIDYVMPTMKGDVLAAAIKTQLPNQPIAMITAHSEVLAGPNNPLTGVEFIIVKPFMLEQLREVIARLPPKT